jgi:P-type E1-E2 ATPase
MGVQLLKGITNLMDIRPDTARTERNGELYETAPENIKVGEIITVKPGEKIPLDGFIIEGESMLDVKALTGESIPKYACAGTEVLSGSINQSDMLKIKTAKTFENSTASKILDLIENASSKKAKTENLTAVRIAKKTKRIVWQNILFALGIKIIFLTLGAFGVAAMWEAVFADVGVTLLVTLNALRALKSNCKQAFMLGAGAEFCECCLGARGAA